MRRRTFAAALLLLSAGCMHHGKDPFRIIGASDVDAMRKAPAAKVVVFDANPESFRKKYGVIPGAVLLASYDSYDLAVLPAEKDTPLVFYCANSH